jgi:hypothetical protein
MDNNFKNSGFVNRAEFLSNLADQYGMSLGDIRELAENLTDAQLKKQLQVSNKKQSKTREVVTSENREEYMKKKMAEKEGKKPNKKEEPKQVKKEKPHGIFHSGTDKIHSHYPSEKEAMASYEALGQKMADHAIGELSAKEMKELGYK